MFVCGAVSLSSSNGRRGICRRRWVWGNGRRFHWSAPKFREGAPDTLTPLWGWDILWINSGGLRPPANFWRPSGPQIAGFDYACPSWRSATERHNSSVTHDLAH